jgi:hypothetical protein
MMRLRELQQDFQNCLLGDAAHLPALNEPAERLDIYRRGYALRLVEALANDFPGLLALLGEAAFAGMARGYIARHPSRHYSLRWLGRQLGDHLDAYAEPLVAGMAHFDWAVALAFDAPDAPIMGLADLLALPAPAWESFGLRFAPGASVITADAVTGDLRRAVLHSEVARPLPTGLLVPWLIWRQGEEVQYRALPPDEASALADMREGLTFDRMCGTLARDFHDEDPARRGAEMLQDWFVRGLVTEIVS